MNNWNAVPKNFATDRYEAGNRIQQRNGGRELALDQSALGRPANEVLYWKAPKEALGDLVTLYDGNIDVHFVNDGKEDAAPSSDEFLWLRGNNIDLVHKIPQTQRFTPNNNATYSVPCNEVRVPEAMIEWATDATSILANIHSQGRDLHRSREYSHGPRRRGYSLD